MRYASMKFPNGALALFANGAGRGPVKKKGRLPGVDLAQALSAIFLAASLTESLASPRVP